ncbi:MAG: cyclase family protein [SAR324 cluster bacterium]|nr:cyclase family protein [SAR324 cluster bacterium]
MAGALIRFDMSLSHYFTYPPAPGVDTRPLIPRKEERQLYMRGEFGCKADGQPRPISAHSTTHLDVPYHFIASQADVAGVLNNRDFVGDRPCLARVVALGGKEDVPGVFTRDGVTYCEAVSAQVLPNAGELRNYETLVILTGFGELMERQQGVPFTPAPDGPFHIPYLDQSAVDVILASGVGMVAIDSNSVESQTSVDPLRMSSESHFRLLGNEPPVLILECLGAGGMKEQVGFVPREGLFHMVPRRVNERGAEAAHGRAFLYFYRDDPQGEALRKLADVMTAEELHG